MPAPGLLAAVAFFVQPQAAASPAAAEPVRYERLHYRDRLESDGQQTRTVEVRVRLGTAPGVEEFGQIAEPYVEGFGDVQFQEVRIEKANGRRVDVEGIVEDVNPFGMTASAMPADVRVKTITIPGLEPGDTLSYRMVHRQAPLAPGRAFGELELPAVEAGASPTYELDVPRAGELLLRLRDGLGASWEELPAAPDRLVRRLALEVEPPADKAPASKAELRKWLEPDVMFTSFRSWSEVSSWWWGLSKERLAADAAVAKEAADLTAGSGGAREKIGALFTFVVTRIRYVNVSFGLGRMRPTAAPEVLKNRYGDCKDKHALLAALASSVGIDVRPVLVNSVYDLLHDDVPGPQQFDHLISVVRMGASPSDWLWLDGTHAYGPAGYLLPNLRDKPALLVEADGRALLVRTPRDPPFVPRHEMSFKGAIDREGVLRGRAAFALRSDVETAFRESFASLAQEELASTIQVSFAHDLGDVTVQNVVLSDPLDTAAPFRVEFDLEKKIVAAGTERAVAPPLADFGPGAAEDPPPADGPVVTFEVRETVARAEIEIPEDQKARAPLSVSVERPFGTFRSVYASEGRTLKAERVLTLRLSALEAADLAAYQSFRDAVARDRQQQFTIEGAAEGTAAAMGADGLRREGMAALSTKDYATAADRLGRAGEIDPQRKDIFEELGHALYGLGRDTEAVAAFSRQIELTPFDDNAYAWRAQALTRLKREDEAEKDLIKQIEVAPFHAWSHQRMGERRQKQGRPGEAVDFFARAAAIEPKKAEPWLALGEAQEQAGQAAEARTSLDRAMALEPAAWLKVRAAETYRKLGDVGRAGELAGAALPGMREWLLRLTPANVDDSHVYWSGRLIDAWMLVGAAAAETGDLPRAERYVEAAWTVGLAPRAARLLAKFRLYQLRPAEALALWDIAAASRRSKGEGASEEPEKAEAQRRLMELRTVKLAGPVLADLTEEVLLLVGGDGAVQSVSNVTRKDAEAFDRQLAKLEPIRLAWTPPDTEPFKMVRRAQFACSAASGCTLTLALH